MICPMRAGVLINMDGGEDELKGMSLFVGKTRDMQESGTSFTAVRVSAGGSPPRTFTSK